jgi:hypothetical protein
MATTIIVHILGEEPFLAEIDQLPDPTDQIITLINPRTKNNKPLHYVADETTSVIFPWHRINFIEVVPGEETRAEVDLFFRT